MFVSQNYSHYFNFHTRRMNESLGHFLKMFKNGQKMSQTSSKSTEWGTTFHEIRKFPENSHA